MGFNSGFKGLKGHIHKTNVFQKGRNGGS